MSKVLSVVDLKNEGLASEESDDGTDAGFWGEWLARRTGSYSERVAHWRTRPNTPVLGWDRNDSFKVLTSAPLLRRARNARVKNGKQARALVRPKREGHELPQMATQNNTRGLPDIHDKILRLSDLKAEGDERLRCGAVVENLGHAEGKARAATLVDITSNFKTSRITTAQAQYQHQCDTSCVIANSGTGQGDRKESSIAKD
ncbi:hypothetical protein B0H66DRAFT_594915 [Apodospora peruviana]|uniref:Uncharacterized protein n=1 Tax=Apodospora peruviana TaxID=516989 RepID=A0AAE0M031_9PEZI|nr:hypothetical protein B0H66DRAFT_594915 [Apodospora peruviana]